MKRQIGELETPETSSSKVNEVDEIESTDASPKRMRRDEKMLSITDLDWETICEKFHTYRSSLKGVKENSMAAFLRSSESGDLVSGTKAEQQLFRKKLIRYYEKNPNIKNPNIKNPRIYDDIDWETICEKFHTYRSQYRSPREKSISAFLRSSESGDLVSGTHREQQLFRKKLIHYYEKNPNIKNPRIYDDIDWETICEKFHTYRSQYRSHRENSMAEFLRSSESGDLVSGTHWEQRLFTKKLIRYNEKNPPTYNDIDWETICKKFHKYRSSSKSVKENSISAFLRSSESGDSVSGTHWEQHLFKKNMVKYKGLTTLAEEYESEDSITDNDYKKVDLKVPRHPNHTCFPNITDERYEQLENLEHYTILDSWAKGENSWSDQSLYKEILDANQFLNLIDWAHSNPRTDSMKKKENKGNHSVWKNEYEDIGLRMTMSFLHLPKPPPPKYEQLSFLIRCAKQKLRGNSANNDYDRELFDFQCLFALAVAVEESLTATLLPLALKHVTRCRSLRKCRSSQTKMIKPLHSETSSYSKSQDGQESDEKDVEGHCENASEELMSDTNESCTEEETQSIVSNDQDFYNELTLPCIESIQRLGQKQRKNCNASLHTFVSSLLHPNLPT